MDTHPLKNRKELARELGISPKTLRRRMLEYDINVKGHLIPLDQEAKIKAIFGIDQPRNGGIQKDGEGDRT